MQLDVEGRAVAYAGPERVGHRVAELRGVEKDGFLDRRNEGRRHFVDGAHLVREDDFSCGQFNGPCTQPAQPPGHPQERLAALEPFFSLLALRDDVRGWDEEYDVTGFIPQELDVNEHVFGRTHLHVVARGLAARATRDGFAQLLLNFPGIGPPVGVLERLAQDIFGFETGRCQRGPVGLD